METSERYLSVLANGEKNDGEISQDGSLTQETLDESKNRDDSNRRIFYIDFRHHELQATMAPCFLT